ncbi:MAG: Lrp/AsnC ligand binding domain-containing protein [Thermoplasmata archaeon]|nr:Lrp/AsnC ligand binding domain-containing protein [Thermoplasmata archaeon]
MAGYNREEMDGILSSYYDEEERVIAIMLLKVDTKEADIIAAKVSSFEQARDVFLVTGDTDIVCKVRFGSYNEMKTFVMEKLAPINGIKDTKTLMVVTPYKEQGKIVEGGD